MTDEATFRLGDALDGEATAFVLPVKPGDVLVVRSDKNLHPDTAKRLKDAMQRILPAGAEVVVVGPDIGLEINHRVEMARRWSGEILRRNSESENTILRNALAAHKAAFHKVAYAKSLHEARSIAMSMIEHGEYP